ncbi:hypothetical protein [Kribbella sp. CA-293567]|uniref:hypothetical protein n=1 Tax=Kribbella sp. CA-293567 TaxID=3002436 RepID=UPI0022DCEDF8|nr:hypothetical protein [Kribbella sp. CA-293567]WBQ04673.1 hypothetical protein OX958_32515 [Kribbella sp. CA-293567]
MGRGLIALDRLAAFVLGLLLLASGAAALAWRYDVFPDAPARIRLPDLPALVTEDWWPWAIGAAGILLVLLALSWLLRHLPRRRINRLSLTGSSAAGRLSADVDSAVGAAAQVLAGTPDVRSCTGHLITDRGEVVAELKTTIEPEADLDQVRLATEQVLTELHQMVGREELRARVLLRTARRPAATPRVV